MVFSVKNSNKRTFRLLFTCVGRRVELMQAFRAAADRLSLGLTLYGTDTSETAPALYFCDRRQAVCRIDDPSYIPQLLSICRREHIDALIPTIDTDLLILSLNKKSFESLGVKVFISESDKISLCRDKRLTARYLLGCGLKTPETYDDYRNYRHDFPCFIKPMDGSSSIGAFKVHGRRELEQYAAQIPDYIVQSFISGTEYTVDILCDYLGNPIYVTPRERLAVRSGEVLKTRICQDARITDACLGLIADFKPCGPLTVQLIRETRTGDDYFIEINPRFGGGAPLSVKAGADSCEAILKILCGEAPAYQSAAARNGAIYSRFDQSICVGGGLPCPVRAVVFDLDDTLYPEKEYVRSGFKAVAALLPRSDGIENKLWRAFEAGFPAIDTVLRAEGLADEEIRAACITAYRNNTPDIRLYDGIRQLLSDLRRGGIRLGIITDGRPEGQRAKIVALGLDTLVDEIIVTDELGGTQFRKPCDIAFRILKGRLRTEYAEMLYVGDNAEKDFTAPEKLGMQCLYFRHGTGLYASAGKGGADAEVSTVADMRRHLGPLIQNGGKDSL